VNYEAREQARKALAELEEHVREARRLVERLGRVIEGDPSDDGVEAVTALAHVGEGLGMKGQELLEFLRGERSESTDRHVHEQKRQA
jgi:hypothetical protein